MRKYRPKPPLHPLHFVAIVCIGFMALVGVTVLVGSWLFNDPLRPSNRWVDKQQTQRLQR